MFRLAQHLLSPSHKKDPQAVPLPEIALEQPAVKRILADLDDFSTDSGSDEPGDEERCIDHGQHRGGCPSPEQPAVRRSVSEPVSLGWPLRVLAGMGSVCSSGSWDSGSGSDLEPGPAEKVSVGGVMGGDKHQLREASPATPQHKAPSAAKAPGMTSPPGRPPGRAPPPRKAPPAKPPPPRKVDAIRGQDSGGAASASTPPKARLPLGRWLSLKASMAATHAPPDSPICGDKTLQEAARIDVDALLGAFAQQPRRTVSAPSPSTSRPRVELLPRNVAHNIAIVWARLGTDGHRLAEAITSLQLSDLRDFPAEALLRLRSVWPAPEVMQPSLQYAMQGKDLSLLRDVERQILPVAQVPRVHERLRLAAVAVSLDERVADALAQLSLLQRACGELQSSSIFRDLVATVVVLFNFVNFGTEVQKAGSTRVRLVDVQSLTRLQETKAYKGAFQGFNMLHFVLQQLRRQRPTLRPEEFAQELSSLQAATRVRMEGLLQELEELRGDFAFVQSELKEHGQAYGVEPDESNVRDPSDESVESEPPGRTSRGSFLERLLQKGLEMARFSEAWLRGDEVMGEAYHPQVGISGFEAVLPEDGEAPPPGWLWVWQPPGSWQRCWCEIRNTILVIYKVEEERCTGTQYFALPAAEIIALWQDNEGAGSVGDACPAAPEGFEIRSASASQVVKLRAGTKREEERWTQLLSAQAQLEGAGFLQVYKDGWPVLRRRCRRGWFYCHVMSGELRAFGLPRDGPEGTPPEHTWDLVGVVVRSLGASDVSAAAQSLVDKTPFGFEVLVAATGQSWQFVCGSFVEERAWLRSLSEDCLANKPGYVDAGGEALREEPLHEEKLEQPAEAAASRHSTKDTSCEDERTGIQRLHDDLNEKVQTWESAFAAAETDCRDLFRFLGLEAPRGAQMGAAVGRLLEALLAFMGQVARALQDLDRHQNQSTPPRRKVERPSQTREPQEQQLSPAPPEVPRESKSLRQRPRLRRGAGRTWPPPACMSCA